VRRNTLPEKTAPNAVFSTAFVKNFCILKKASKPCIYSLTKETTHKSEVVMKIFSRTGYTVLFLFVCLAAGRTQAQDLGQQLSSMSQQAAVGYTSPLLGNWANDMNSGIYHTAAVHKILGFDLSVNVALARLSDGDKTYTATLPATIKYSNHTLTAGTDYPTTITAATAVGSKDVTPIKTTSDYKEGSTVVVPSGTTIAELPGGYDLPTVPLPMPQFSLGLPFGIEVMARYVPTVSIGDEGKYNTMGFGVRYDVAQWIPVCPVDISLHFMTQKLNFKSKDGDDIFSGKGTAYGLEVSKKLLILTLYGGFQLESSSMTVNDYTYTDPSGNKYLITGFDVTGSNKSRVTLGATIKLFILNINAEYSFASTPIASVGVGLSIR
jgi:hypothetical protein